jgi:hypothetical protein
MTSRKLQLRPHVSVQFEITGDESDAWLAYLKRLEQELELRLAAHLVHVLQAYLPSGVTSLCNEVKDGVGRKYDILYKEGQGD